jgi:hypothetical protein
MSLHDHLSTMGQELFDPPSVFRVGLGAVVDLERDRCSPATASRAT